MLWETWKALRRWLDELLGLAPKPLSPPRPGGCWDDGCPGMVVQVAWPVSWASRGEGGTGSVQATYCPVCRTEWHKVLVRHETRIATSEEERANVN